MLLPILLILLGLLLVFLGVTMFVWDVKNNPQLEGIFFIGMVLGVLGLLLIIGVPQGMHIDPQYRYDSPTSLIKTNGFTIAVYNDTVYTSKDDPMYVTDDENVKIKVKYGKNIYNRDISPSCEMVVSKKVGE